MKTVPFYIFILCLLVSCKKSEISSYNGQTNIYFSSALDPIPSWGRDSLSVSFALKALVKDSLIKIPVRVMGKPSDADRIYAIKIATGSNAKEGIHYDFYKENFTIPAGKLVDSLQVLLHRSPDLKNNGVSVVFELVPNNNFTTQIQNEKPVPGYPKGYSFNTFRLNSNDILQMPESWIDYYLGDFTAKKFYLIGEVLGADLNKFSGPAFVNISFSDLLYYGVALQRYLNNQKAAGKTVYEVNGDEMIMGPGVQ